VMPSETELHGTATDTPVPVAFVSSHATRGGAERYLALLLEHLPDEWIRTVICLKDGDFVDDLRARGHDVEVIDTGPHATDIVRAARSMRKSFARSRPEVVHANGLKAALVAEVATAGTRTPVVWFKHDVSRDGWLARLAARRSARVIAASAGITKTFSAALRGKIEVLHYQLPTPEVDAVGARRLVLGEFKEDAPTAVVSLVARIDAYKGHREVIAAAPRVLSSVPGVRFLFVGGEDPAHPGMRAALEGEVFEAGLEYAFRFTGFRADALELISGSDVLVVPSIASGGFGQEGFPYVGLEALALGTPIVAYAHGGLPEQVGDCGELVPSGDREALGEAILRLVDDPDHSAALAACGRERFERLFRWSTLVDDVADRYRLVATEASPR
jgi:glycosyltransferase involved in cell wall biosynthesis